MKTDAAHEKRDRGMYCSICGAPIPRGRRACETCGGHVRRTESRGSAIEMEEGAERELRVRFGAARSCPRCDYYGQGLPYFTRGPHMAALIGATLFTLPYALGAGGFLYYGMRRDHRVCPRCGHGWGRRGEGAGERVGRPRAPVERGSAHSLPGGGLMRAWSVILFGLGAVLLTVGAVEFEAILLAFGVLAAAGGVVLHRAANRAREESRAALLAALQLPVLKLASERSGRLTVTDVAASLGWPLPRAERVLHSLDDGWRVSSEVPDEGVIVYEFRELLLGPGREE
ncbi:MAG TPA: hypothetical protein VMN39_10340 [Longimicrobiaceae bacterium]|nr:hypothetical protein [Longimicrobiaceae bacterium]